MFVRLGNAKTSDADVSPFFYFNEFERNNKPKLYNLLIINNLGVAPDTI